MIEMKASDYEKVADLLLSIGWESRNDAQFARLRDAMPKLASIFAAARQASEPADVDENQAVHAILNVTGDTVVKIADEMHAAAHSLKHITRRDVDVYCLKQSR